MKEIKFSFPTIHRRTYANQPSISCDLKSIKIHPPFMVQGVGQPARKHSHSIEHLHFQRFFWEHLQEKNVVAARVSPVLYVSACLVVEQVVGWMDGGFEGETVANKPNILTGSWFVSLSGIALENVTSIFVWENFIQVNEKWLSLYYHYYTWRPPSISFRAKYSSFTFQPGQNEPVIIFIIVSQLCSK